MDKKEFYNVIPPDDITLFYCEAPQPVRSAVSLLLQMNERFYTFAATADRKDNRAVCVLDEASYGDVLYNVLFDFVQRYGHLQFFRILLEFLDSNTHPVTASMLHDMLTRHLNEAGNVGESEEIEDEEKPEGEEWN